MLWKKLLKNAQAPCIIPPHYSTLTVEQSKCRYLLTLPNPPKTWSLASLNGKILREAYPYEVLRELKKYPKKKVCLFKKEVKYWLYTTDKGIGRIKVIEPYQDLPILPLTILILRFMGTVPVVEDIDIKLSKTKEIILANSYLQQDNLEQSFDISFLNDAQKLAFNLLLEEERSKRIPPTEKKIKDTISKYGELFSIEETRDGYIIRFTYRGRTRKVVVNEDLRVMDINMCMEGSHRKFDLESLLMALKYEDTGEFGIPTYY